MAHFEVGKKVIVIQPIPLALTDGTKLPSIKKGEIFTLLSIQMSFCKCKYILLDIGKTSLNDEMSCSVCKIDYKTNKWLFPSEFFAPLEEDELSDTTIEEVLENMEVHEYQGK